MFPAVRLSGRLRLATASLLLVALASQVAPVAGRPAAVASSQPTYVGKFELPYFATPAVRPRVLAPRRTLYALHLHWSGWGTLRATARGVAAVNTCVPDCAQGRPERQSGVRVVLYGREARTCNSAPAFFYTQVRFVWPRVVPRNGYSRVLRLNLTATC